MLHGQEQQLERMVELNADWLTKQLTYHHTGQDKMNYSQNFLR